MTDNFEIRECENDRKQHLDLLLIGDEQEDMIDRYLNRSRLFIGFINGQPVACCAITIENTSTVEIKNLAVLPEHRRKGIGRSMLAHAETLYPDMRFLLGTGETPSTLRFYENCGYRYSHRIPGFFTANYRHPIVEEGVLLNDMLYLCKHTS